MQKIIVNNTILLFLGVNDFSKFENRGLLNLKNHYLKIYDNCIIYNYFHLLNNKNIIRDKINKLRFTNQRKINARQCQIKNISKSDKNDFLNKYHIQGTDKSQVHIGAYFNDELIAVMCFDYSAGLNGGLNAGEVILSRFSIKTGIIVVGIFNKILNAYIKEYHPKKIISYGDLNFVSRTNNVYLSNGFKFNRVIQPDFTYYNKINNRLYHKFTYGNKYLKNTNISDIEKKKTLNELSKLWNCGKLKYELILNDNNVPVFGIIYMIRNNVNDKCYIGQTIRLLEKRIYEYKSWLKTGDVSNTYLYNAFQKHGWDNFEFKIIDTATSLAELNEKEIRYIQQHKSNQKEFGYNIESGGCNSIPNIETLEKMSHSHRGIKQTDIWVNKRIAKAGTDDAKKYGRTKTNEEKQELSLKSPKYWLGKNRDIETREKISKTKKEKGLSVKQKEVLCKKVYKINTVNNNIVEYDSTKHASTIEGVNQSTVSRWCKNEKIVNGFLWKY
jgi:group I intron endonuclease